MEQVAKLKRTSNIAPVLQIVQKISENCSCLLSLNWPHLVTCGCGSKIYSKMHPGSCNNTHHDNTELVNHDMVKNTKTLTSWEQNIAFLWNKKILNLNLRWHILRSYHFKVEVTFNTSLIWFCFEKSWLSLLCMFSFCVYPEWHCKKRSNSSININM